MKNFLGVTIVQAEPASKDGVSGYKVVYGDGYESWSPKDVFEAAYLELDDATKVTPGVVDEFLGDVTGSRIDEKTTLAKATALSGFVEYATSSCVDPENYNHELGMAVATKRIKDTLWQCLGFVLQWGKDGLKR